MTILSSAREGMHRAEDRLQRVAERLARLPISGDSPPEDSVDLSAEVISLLEAKTGHAANAKVAQAAAEMEQSGLDLLA